MFFGFRPPYRETFLYNFNKIVVGKPGTRECVFYEFGKITYCKKVIADRKDGVCWLLTRNNHNTLRKTTPFAETGNQLHPMPFESIVLTH